MQNRRIVAVVVLVVVVILIALLVHGCESSSAKNSLRDYNNAVYQVIGDSNKLGTKLFRDLENAHTSGASTVENEILSLHNTARSQLTRVEDLSVPAAMSGAQQHLVTVMRLRYDGVGIIASNIQTALGSNNTSKDAVQEMAAATARFYASDVLYKGYVGPEIAGALSGAGIDVGSDTINSGQFVHDLGWLTTTFIGVKVGAKLPPSVANTNVVPGGIYGHQLNSVAVGSNTMVAGVTNHVAASPAPTFTLNLTNGGQYTENDVVCKVSVAGASDSATSTIAQTKPGQQTSCRVTLPSPPPTGPQTVTATVEKVPGEKNVANNSQHFVVDFTSS